LNSFSTILLTVNKRHQHTPRRTQISINLCLQQRVIHTITPTRNTITKLAALRNYQQRLLRLPSRDTRSSQQRGLKADPKGSRNCQLAQHTSQRNSNRHKHHPDLPNGDFLLTCQLRESKWSEQLQTEHQKRKPKFCEPLMLLVSNTIMLIVHIKSTLP
jgi:hypothetical protein